MQFLLLSLSLSVSPLAQFSVFSFVCMVACLWQLYNKQIGISLLLLEIGTWMSGLKFSFTLFFVHEYWFESVILHTVILVALLPKFVPLPKTLPTNN